MNPPSPVMLPSGPPPVLAWFKIYCAILAVLYAACTVGIPILFSLSDDYPEENRALNLVIGVLMTGLCAILFVASILPFFLKPKPWVWIYDLVLIAIGLTSACFLPICIPLLIFWLKPETGAWFGRTQARPAADARGRVD